MKALVFAAGLGERMRPLTDTTPKPLLLAGGKPLIEWHLEKLAAIGIREVVVNTSWLAEQFPRTLGDGSRWGIDLHCIYEGATPLETGGGLWNALPFLRDGDEAFIAVNGDVWTDFDFAQTGIDADADAHLVLVPNPPQHPRGDFTLAGGRVGEDSSPGAMRYTYSGLGVYRPGFFAGCTPGRFPLLPLLQRAIAARRLTGQLYGGLWQDIGTPERLAAINAAVPVK